MLWPLCHKTGSSLGKLTDAMLRSFSLILFASSMRASRSSGLMPSTTCCSHTKEERPYHTSCLLLETRKKQEGNPYWSNPSVLFCSDGMLFFKQNGKSLILQTKRMGHKAKVLAQFVANIKNTLVCISVLLFSWFFIISSSSVSLALSYSSFFFVHTWWGDMILAKAHIAFWWGRHSPERP